MNREIRIGDQVRVGSQIHQIINITKQYYCLDNCVKIYPNIYGKWVVKGLEIHDIRIQFLPPDLSDTNPIPILPDDPTIQQFILMSLSDQDLCFLSQVNREYYEICQRDDLWKLKIVQKWGPKIFSLRFKRRDGSESLLPELNSDIYRSMKNLYAHLININLDPIQVYVHYHDLFMLNFIYHQEGYHLINTKTANYAAKSNWILGLDWLASVGIFPEKMSEDGLHNETIEWLKRRNLLKSDIPPISLTTLTLPPLAKSLPPTLPPPPLPSPPLSKSLPPSLPKSLPPPRLLSPNLQLFSQPLIPKMSRIGVNLYVNDDNLAFERSNNEYVCKGRWDGYKVIPLTHIHMRSCKDSGYKIVGRYIGENGLVFENHHDKPICVGGWDEHNQKIIPLTPEQRLYCDEHKIKRKHDSRSHIFLPI